MPYNQQTSRLNRRRAGIASLEFVLSLPFLFVLMAMIFTLGNRALHQAEVTMEVRDRAWLGRSGVEASESASKPFEFGAATAGSTEARITKELRMYRWLGGERTSVGETTLIAGTWDHQQVPELRGSKPHASMLSKLGTAGGTGAVRTMARLLNF